MEEIKKIKKRQTLIMICLLVQALMILCLVLRINSLIGIINDLNGSLLEIQEQFNVLLTHLNDFIQLFTASPIK